LSKSDAGKALPRTLPARSLQQATTICSRFIRSPYRWPSQAAPLLTNQRVEWPDWPTHPPESNG
jgi:hypothetical protein